ncbi:ThiF family adenylyltransferase [Streptomyces sp. NPDC086182]|uniref:HesA/MoeB/ThiF family protein n=1 Tax=Streptomyces sp. NPDC086182 TaxID=3155058 RepID=UPI003432D196
MDATRIALKTSAWERVGDVLIVACDPTVQIELEDPYGQAEMLLRALSAGPWTLRELQQHLEDQGLPVTIPDLLAAVRALDSLRLLADPSQQSFGYPTEDERYHSNLAFFDLFTSLERSRTELQRRLLGAHVLQLGTGGVGSTVVQHLAGLGVGRLTLLDFDVVEPRNFSRQFLYRTSDIGRSKVQRAAEWVRSFDPRIRVDVVEGQVSGPADVAALLGGVDVVSAGIDHPNAVDDWVNEACMDAGVPFVRAGISGSRLVYFSVDPGHSPCLACARKTDEEIAASTGIDASASRLSSQLPTVNRAIGPVAGLLGSMVAFELLRYVTRYEEPQAAGTRVFWDATDGLAQRRQPWRADPGCHLCHQARERIASPIKAAA